jgi:hypothetical protein
MKRTLTLATLITLGAAAWMPLPSMAETSFSLVINSAPPPPRFESAPAPRRGYVWAPGYWNWDGGRHVWLAGHWETVRDGYQYQSGEWIREGGGYRLRAGGWQPVAQVRYDEILVAPPSPRYERIPHARDGYVWQPGYWDWRGKRYEWISGIWIAERPGHAYMQPKWVQRDGRWFMEQSRWVARDGRDRDHDGIPDRYEHGRHDQDHDGVPNRRDKDRDGDGVPNRRDKDRDGDGVPNKHDARPDNPRRY